MKYDSKNISIMYVVIGIMFAIMFAMLFSKMEVNAQTYYKTDISITNEVQYQTSGVRVYHNDDDGMWYFVDRNGTEQSFDTSGWASTGYDDETYLHFREALYQDDVLYGFRHYIYFFTGNVEYVTMPSDGSSLIGMDGMYTVSSVKYTIESDELDNIETFRYERYYNGKLTYPSNWNYGTGSSYQASKDIKTLTAGYGGSIRDAEGNDFFRVTPQGTIAMMIQKNQIQLNPLQEIVKVLPMVILFLVGYLGLWKALEIFRRLLRKA